MQTLQKENEVIQDKLNNIESHVNSVETKHKCEKCKFTTSSEQGLKTHISKKHKAGKKKEETLKFPTTCELCEKNDKREMIKHQKNHSYTYFAFKCVKYDFLGEDEIEMEVHLGIYMVISLNVVCVTTMQRIWKT